jgi:hypothetical protein
MRDSYPIPILGQLLNQLQGCKYFTKIDLKAAFNLLRVAKEHEWKTAFCTPWGLYEYLVMPFGLANAPACFQCFIQFVLRKFLSVSCYVYIDDILVFRRPERNTSDTSLRSYNAFKITASLLLPRSVCSMRTKSPSWVSPSPPKESRWSWTS